MRELLVLTFICIFSAQSFGFEIDKKFIETTLNAEVLDSKPINEIVKLTADKLALAIEVYLITSLSSWVVYTKSVNPIFLEDPYLIDTDKVPPALAIDKLISLFIKKIVYICSQYFEENKIIVNQYEKMLTNIELHNGSGLNVCLSMDIYSKLHLVNKKPYDNIMHLFKL